MTRGQGASRLGWYYGWNIVALCVLSQAAANGVSINAFSLFLHDWSAELHTPVSTLQLPVAGLALVGAVLSPVIGAFADKYPAKLLLALGLAVMTGFYLGVSWMRASWQFLVLYTLVAPLGIGLSTAIPANALLSRWFVRRRGLAMGLSAFGLTVAGAALPPVIALVMPHLGWRSIWRATGLIVGLVAMPLIGLAIRERPTEADGQAYLSGDAESAPHHGHGATRGGADQLGWGQIVRRRNLWLLIAAYVPLMALQAGTMVNLAPFAANHGLDRQAAGALISILSVAQLTANLVLGLLSDRLGPRRAFAGLSLVVSVGAASLAIGQGFSIIALGAALVGFGGGLFTLLAAGIAAEFGTAGFGRAYGLSLVFVPVSMLAPFVIARVQEVTGSYAPPYLALMLLALLGGGLALLMRENRAAPPIVPNAASA
jgi:MFS family permease